MKAESILATYRQLRQDPEVKNLIPKGLAQVLGAAEKVLNDFSQLSMPDVELDGEGGFSFSVSYELASLQIFFYSASDIYAYLLRQRPFEGSAEITEAVGSDLEVAEFASFLRSSLEEFLKEDQPRLEEKSHEPVGTLDFWKAREIKRVAARTLAWA